MRARAAVLVSLAIAATIAAAAAAFYFASPPRQASDLPFKREGTDLKASDVDSALRELSQRVREVESGQAALRNAALLQAGQIGTVQAAIEAQRASTESRVSALEGKVAASVSVRKRLDYSDGASSNAVSASYAPLRDIGKFSKGASSTGLLLTWNTHIDALGEPGTFCDFQLRVDGRPDEESEGGGGRAVVYVPPSASGGSSPVTVTALFGRVGAGGHSVGVFLRGNARECLENYGNFPRSVIVEEGP